jgi:hypothetical protein
VFADLGLEIKRRSPFKHTLVLELSNDNPAYIPTVKAFEEGSYETVNSRIAPGGGERLAEIVADLSCRVVATEEWHVNAPVATRRLRPLGIGVLHCSSLCLPLRDASVDLVLDRHEALEPAEVARVLAAGGAVVTQQVGPDNWPELRRFFPRKTDFGDHYREYQLGFADAGLVVTDARWHEERVAFASLADVCFMLAVAPWFIEGFDPEREVDQLIALEDAHRTPNGIVLTEMRYLIVARKPAGG